MLESFQQKVPHYLRWDDDMNVPQRSHTHSECVKIHLQSFLLYTYLVPLCCFSESLLIVLIVCLFLLTFMGDSNRVIFH